MNRVIKITATVLAAIMPSCCCPPPEDDFCNIVELPNGDYWAYCEAGDSDLDGVPDQDEHYRGTDPYCYDTDGDGIDDGPVRSSTELRRS